MKANMKSRVAQLEGLIEKINPQKKIFMGGTDYLQEINQEIVDAEAQGFDVEIVEIVPYYGEVSPK